MIFLFQYCFLQEFFLILFASFKRSLIEYPPGIGNVLIVCSCFLNLLIGCILHSVGSLNTLRLVSNLAKHKAHRRKMYTVKRYFTNIRSGLDTSRRLVLALLFHSLFPLLSLVLVVVLLFLLVRISDLVSLWCCLIHFLSYK